MRSAARRCPAHNRFLLTMARCPHWRDSPQKDLSFSEADNVATAPKCIVPMRIFGWQNQPLHRSCESTLTNGSHDLTVSTGHGAALTTSNAVVCGTCPARFFRFLAPITIRPACVSSLTRRISSTALPYTTL